MEPEAAVGALAFSIAEHVGLYIAAVLVGTGVGAVLGTLMFGRRYKQRIAALEARQNAVQINVNVNGRTAASKQASSLPAAERSPKWHVAERDPDTDILRIGTTLGPMTVRLNHEKTLEDVLAILSKHEVLASLSDEYDE